VFSDVAHEFEFSLGEGSSGSNCGDDSERLHSSI
jgi:hypothetical protein